jgi:hypothetical protein
LARHTDELESKLVASKSGCRQRKQIEENRPVLSGVDAKEIELLFLLGPAVKDSKVGGFSTRGGAVINDLGPHVLVFVVYFYQSDFSR